MKAFWQFALKPDDKEASEERTLLYKHRLVASGAKDIGIRY